MQWLAGFLDQLQQRPLFKTTLDPFNQSVKHWEVQLLVSTYVRIHRYI